MYGMEGSHTLQKSIEDGIDKRYVPEERQTELHRAISIGDQVHYDRLLYNGVWDVGALFEACRLQYVDVVAYMLNNKRVVLSSRCLKDLLDCAVTGNILDFVVPQIERNLCVNNMVQLLLNEDANLAQIQDLSNVVATARRNNFMQAVDLIEQVMKKG
jgi:hypothetical protein